MGARPCASSYSGPGTGASQLMQRMKTATPQRGQRLGGGSCLTSRETTSPRRQMAACVCGIAIYAIGYLRLPIKAFYLIPAVPFTLLLLGRLLSRRAFLAVCLALVASPWVLKVSQPGKPDSLGPTAGTVTLGLGGQPWTVDLLRGPILADHERRAHGMRYVEGSLARARGLPGESVIVAYDWLPQIRVRLSGKRDGRVEYVYLLSAGELADLRRREVSVYDLAGAEAENVKVNGVSLRENGARPLDDMN